MRKTKPEVVARMRVQLSWSTCLSAQAAVGATYANSPQTQANVKSSSSRSNKLAELVSIFESCDSIARQLCLLCS